MPSPLRSKLFSARAFASACAVCAVLSSFGLPAHAAATPRPLPSLRHLAFNFDVTVNDQTETKIEGMAASSSGGNSGGGPGVSPDSGSRMTAGQTRKSSASSTRKGQILVDVVAATEADSGLVVDVTQVSSDKAVPRVRVAITQDGALSYDPSNELSAEEIALLKLLGRGVIGSKAREKGDEWTIPESATNYSEQTTYKVVDAPASGAEVVTETGVFQQTGIHPADGTTQGRITFDPAVVVPDAATITSHVRHANLGSTTTTVMTIELTLAEDSFAKKKTP